MNIHARLLSLLALAIVLTTPLSAARWIVPAAASAPGASGTRWKTDLRLVNPDDAHAATARIYFLAAGAEHPQLPAGVTVDVAAGGQAVLADVLASRFGAAGTGSLLVDSPATLIVTSRTYNDTGSATYGQFVPGVRLEEALPAGETGHLVYLTKNADYRSNVGFAGTTATAGNVTVTLFDAANLRLGAATFPLPAFGQQQINDIFTAAGAAPAEAARAELVATVPIVAYGSVVDNRTGDPIAVMAQRTANAARELTLPAVAHADGANGSQWRSDIRLFNTFTRTASVTLTYRASTGTTIDRVLSVGPRQTAVLEDVLVTTFQQGSGIGGILIRADQDVLVASRTYNATASGTFGQDVRAIPAGEAVQPTETARLSGLTNDGYRSNLGLFSLSAAPLDLELALRSASGSTLATKPLRLEANRMVQLNDVFAVLGVTSPVTASLSIRTTAGTGSYLAYASVVDNRSGDPVYVPATVAAPAAVQGDCVTVPFARAGLVATYRAGTSTRETTVISDVAARSEYHEVVTAPGTAPITIDTVFDFDLTATMRNLRRSVSKARTSVSGFNVDVNTDSTFTPSMPASPISAWCTGAKWPMPAVTQTVVITGTGGTQNTVIHRVAAEGEVLSTNEVVTTPAGTFTTVKYKGVHGATEASVQSSILWLSIEHGIYVRQDNLDANGNVFSSMELTGLR